MSLSGRWILAYGAYLPFHRLDRSEIAPVAGSGGGTGTRTVASYDEDTTTMAVEAARALERPGLGLSHVGSLWFATTTPAYADKTNATAIHAALGLDAAAPAFDVNGAVRSALGALRAGLGASGSGTGPALVVASDVRTGLPGSADEAAGGDGAAALLVGPASDGAAPLAEVVGWGSATSEFLDRWRSPGALRSQVWEERFGEGRYVQAGRRAWKEALAGADVGADEVDHLAVVSAHARAASSFRRSVVASTGTTERRDEMGVNLDGLDGLDGTVGFTGAAHPFLTLAATLEVAGPGEVVALVTLADGADVVLLRTTDAITIRRGHDTVAAQVAGGGPVTYGRYLAWRGILPVEPPRRPEPARPSASAAGRSASWKFGFVGSEAGDGTVHLPPSPLDALERPMADATGTVATFTVDRMAYSPSPPVVFAVVDFDGGGRLPVELTDVDPATLHIGDRVEMTFRRLFTADGIHNYFWKARPIRQADAGAADAAGEGD